MFEASITVTFRAWHHVRYPTGEWESPHAHEWRVEAHFRSATLDSADMVVDFLAAREALEAIVRPWEGGDLNVLLRGTLDNPTAERIAYAVYSEMQRRAEFRGLVERVAVEEAPGCRAVYARDR